MIEEAEYPPATDLSDLLRAITRELGLSAVPEPSCTLAQLGVDSLGLFQVVCLVEDWVGSTLNEGSADYPVLETVADVLSFYQGLHTKASSNRQPDRIDHDVAGPGQINHA